MAFESFDVSGDVIVTGGTKGIGKVTARKFLEAGCNVGVCSRDPENVDTAVDELGEHGDVYGEPVDVREYDNVESFVDNFAAEFDGVDVLVNNAGASFMAAFDGISPNGWDSIVEINLRGTYNCCHAAADHLKDGGGAVVNLSSVAGVQGAPMMSHYGAAKAGVINLTSSLAYEWAPHDVRVNCLAPGFIATKGVEQQMGVSADEIERSEVKRRMGEPEEAADVILFLASPASSFMVGETVQARGLPDIMEKPDA